MPTYEYECAACGHTLEAFQSMSEAPLSVCPACGKELRRLITGGSGVIFKGSGFYVTDKKGSPAKAKPASDKAPPSSAESPAAPSSAATSSAAATGSATHDAASGGASSHGDAASSGASHGAGKAAD
jgi:putative FmdB family regulatory protein